MKKYLITGILAILLIMPIVGAANITNEKYEVQPSNILSGEDFTHTVFAEYGTTTTCPYCPGASSAMYSIYQSGDYPLYYVSLVGDKNSVAATRLYYLAARGVPVVYFDGGETNIVGDVGEAQYRTIIEEMGAREVKLPIDMTTTVTWDGDAKITVTITLTNNGGFYLGLLKSYVTEIESRWNDNDGNPYHYAFVDFAFNRPIILFGGKERTFTKQFDFSKNHGGETFEDITEDNIQVVSTVSYLIPQKREGYEEAPFYAFLVDQASAGMPS